MSQALTAATAKVAALWDCVGRWTAEMNQIRSPQDVYQQNYQAIRSCFDHQLQQVSQRSISSDGYRRGADALVKIAGEMKEHEIQYSQSVAAMEQDYRERLDAAHRTFAHGIIGAFGDTWFDPWVQDRLRQAVVPQESTAETDMAGREPNTAPHQHCDLEADLRPIAHMILKSNIPTNANSSPGPRPAPEDAALRGNAPEDRPSSREAEVPIPHENRNPEGNPSFKAPCPDTFPAQHTSPTPGTNTTPQVKPCSKANSAAEEDPAPQVNPAPQMNSATETNPTSGTNLPSEANVAARRSAAPEKSAAPETSAAPEKSFEPQTDQSSQSNPASDANPVPETNPVPKPNPVPETDPSRSNSVTGTNITQNKTPPQQAKEAREPILTTDSQVPVRETQGTNPPSQHEGSHNDTPPARSSSNNRMVSDSPAVNLRTSSKRLSETTTDQQTQKRPRYNDMPTTSTKERVIDFNQVFQGGNAQVKYLIAQFPTGSGAWYILECKEHHKHFMKSPIRAAARHLSSGSHGPRRLTKEHSLTVETLGTRVLNCNAALAEKNNEVARAAFSKQLGIPRRESPGTSIPECTLIPVVGEIYAVPFPRLRFLYPVLVLPWVSFDHFDWKASMLRLTPPCYVFNKNIHPHPVGWATGYEDGGPLVNQRQYPVMYFDGRRFPGQGDVNWVPISSFKPFDPNDTNIVHRNDVAEYLRTKDSRLSCNPRASSRQYIVISDDENDDGDDPDTANDVKQEDAEEGPARGKRTSDNNGENATTGEQGKDGENRSNKDGQGDDRQGQTKPSSHGGMRNSGNDSGQGKSPTRRKDNNRSAGIISGTKARVLVGKVPDNRPQPTLPSAPEWRSEARFVAVESSETGQAGFKPQATSSDSSSRQPTTGVEGQRAGALEHASQSSQPPPEGAVSQPQHRVTPPRLPADKDLATLAAQAIMSTATEDSGARRPTGFPITEIKGAVVDVYHPGTKKWTTVNRQ